MTTLSRSVRLVRRSLVLAMAAGSTVPAFAQSTIGGLPPGIPGWSNPAMRTQMLITAAGAGRAQFDQVLGAASALAENSGLLLINPGPCRDETEAFFLHEPRAEYKSRQVALTITMRAAIKPAEALRLCDQGPRVLSSYGGWYRLTQVSDRIQNVVDPQLRSTLASRISTVTAQAAVHARAEVKARDFRIIDPSCATVGCTSNAVSLTLAYASAYEAALDAHTISRNIKAKYFPSL